MEEIWPYLGNLHVALARHPALAGLTLIAVSMLCGLLVGIERETKDKPAGLRTVSLICVGCTIFTLASIYIPQSAQADASRIAAQVASGIGFLGAGAIIRQRGTVIGLTTAASIWVVAAIGVLIGAGYAAAGMVLTLLVLAMLVIVERVEDRVFSPCRFRTCRVTFTSNRGKTRVRVRRVLDLYRIPAEAYTFEPDAADPELEMLEVRYCDLHRQHRAFLERLMRLVHVRSFEEGPWLESDHPGEKA